VVKAVILQPKERFVITLLGGKFALLRTGASYSLVTFDSPAVNNPVGMLSCYNHWLREENAMAHVARLFTTILSTVALAERGTGPTI
jgi:hypothetical protein